MPCNRPLPAWYTKHKNENGKHVPTFTFQEADTSRKLELPCGKCIGCRLEKSRQWAIRLMQEAKMHDHSWFATLTYDEEKVPPGGTLRPEDFVLFMKRLRHKHPGVRYYQCGEYGETTNRPHHHAILFNCEFTDLAPLNRTREDAHALYASKELESTWQQGICSVGAVTFESAAYCASYVTKKITGPEAAAHYQGRVPEYSTMSRRPGIGRTYWATYKQEIIDHDEVIVRGFPMRPPKYYDRILDQEDDDQRAIQKAKRLETIHSLTHRQREAREINALAKLKRKARTL